MTLEEMAAHEAIRQTPARYCPGVDRGDLPTLLSVYHDPKPFVWHKTADEILDSL